MARKKKTRSRKTALRPRRTKTRKKAVRRRKKAWNYHLTHRQCSRCGTHVLLKNVKKHMKEPHGRGSKNYRPYG